MKKNFEIIEEGRLSKKEMGKIVGGGNKYYCKLEQSGAYKVSTCKINGTASSFSACMWDYYSCDKTGNASCSFPNSYEGKTGPQGYEVYDGKVVPTDLYSEFLEV
ncbi:MAG: hypothetical protein LBU51_05240 [Bacteroidales bacterium]|jgi:hypothetical protein|nr:hypothetical protein [Bacteroidales bacterium]